MTAWINGSRFYLSILLNEKQQKKKNDYDQNQN